MGWGVGEVDGWGKGTLGCQGPSKHCYGKRHLPQKSLLSLHEAVTSRRRKEEGEREKRRRKERHSSFSRLQKLHYLNLPRDMNRFPSNVRPPEVGGIYVPVIAFYLRCNCSLFEIYLPFM